MASAFGHAASAWAIGNLFGLKKPLPWFIVLTGVVLSIFPDIDVLGFRYGIAYESFFGHRGFTHSIFFAILIAATCTWFFRKSGISLMAVFTFLFLCTLSHSLLDACTTGGKGVAFFSPFSNERYFLPWKVIKVSPLSIQTFFTEWGRKVIFSEMKWIGIPAIFTFVLLQAKKYLAS